LIPLSAISFQNLFSCKIGIASSRRRGVGSWRWT